MVGPENRFLQILNAILCFLVFLFSHKVESWSFQFFKIQLADSTVIRVGGDRGGAFFFDDFSEYCESQFHVLMCSLLIHVCIFCGLLMNDFHSSDRI